MELSVLGWSQHQIAADLGVSQAAVSKILKRVELRVLHELMAVVERQKARHTLRLEHIFAEALWAWEQSKADTTRRRQRQTQPGSGGNGGTVAELVVQTQHGDPRYLDEARKALSNGDRARYGSITSKWEHFAEWKRNDEKEKGSVEAEVLLNGMLAHERLLDLVENFVLFDDSRPGGTRKIVARNHQVLGVNNAVGSVELQEELKLEFPPDRRLRHRVSQEAEAIQHFELYGRFDVYKTDLVRGWIAPRLFGGYGADRLKDQPEDDECWSHRGITAQHL